MTTRIATEERKVTIPKTVPVTVYVAEDGTEFNSEDECLSYEAYCKLEERQLQDCPPYGEWIGSIDYCYDWYIIETEEDVGLIELAFGVDASAAEVGDIVCIKYENEYRFIYTDKNEIYYLEEQINAINDMLYNLGYEVRKRET